MASFLFCPEAGGALRFLRRLNPRIPARTDPPYTEIGDNDFAIIEFPFQIQPLKITGIFQNYMRGRRSACQRHSE